MLVVYGHTMGIPPHLCLKSFLILVLLNGLLLTDSGYDRQIQRSKRDLDENESIGDALYDIKHKVDKREEIPIPATSNTEDNGSAEKDTDDTSDSDIKPVKSKALKESNTKTDDSNETVNKKDNKPTADESLDETVARSESEIGSRKQRQEKRHKKYHERKLTQARNDVSPSKKEKKTKKEPKEESGKLVEGMHANVNHPIIDTEQIKQYQARYDVSHGEMMGIDNDKRDDVLHTSNNNLLDDNDESETLLTEHKRNADEKTSTMEQSFNGIATVNGESSKLYKRDGGHTVEDTHDTQDFGSPSHFQVDDKSADLEINANSAGVKVKAKPASLQVVSRPGTLGHAPFAQQPISYVQPPVEMYHQPIRYHHYHHHPHHHHRHRHHHHPHHVQFLPEPYNDYEYHHHAEESHHDMPHFFDVPRYGDTWGHGMGGRGWGGDGGGGGRGYEDGMRHGYGRGLIEGARERAENAFSRSTVESAMDPRLGSTSSLFGFNSGIALPDNDNMFVNHLRNDLSDDAQRAQRAQMLHHLHDTALSDMLNSHDSDESERRFELEAQRYNSLSRFHQHTPAPYQHIPEPYNIHNDMTDLLSFRQKEHEREVPQLNSKGSMMPELGSKGRVPFREKESEREALEMEPKGAYDRYQDKAAPLYGEEEPGHYIPDLPKTSEFIHRKPAIEQRGTAPIAAEQQKKRTLRNRLRYV